MKNFFSRHFERNEKILLSEGDPSSAFGGFRMTGGGLRHGLPTADRALIPVL